MFSRRTSFYAAPSTLFEATSTILRKGGEVWDLTESNPTRADIFDMGPLLARLGHAEGARYEPAPLGQLAARQAVSRYYQERGAIVDPSAIVLSASTSESYAWLFKLLCDPGDDVLIARPGYPLFESLAELEGVSVRGFELSSVDRYRIHIEEIARSLGHRTRAIVLVHPNNPTGSFIHPEDAQKLLTFAAERGLALIVDEVFGDYSLRADRIAEATDNAPHPATFAGVTEGLVFVLSGLSKVLLLPQCKLAWTVAAGEADLVKSALDRLEWIADTYLSVSTAIQLALPDLLARRDDIQHAALARLRENLATLDALLVADTAEDTVEGGSRGAGVRRDPVEGGWYATIVVPRFHSEERWVATLLREEGVLVQPGFFFDHAEDGRLVVSLLTRPHVFHEGITRLLRYVNREVNRETDETA